MTTPYVQGELMTPGKMYDRIESRLKALEAASQGWLGENNTGTAVTLATAATTYVGGSASLTFTLTTQRRVRIVALAQFNNASSANAGRYTVNPAYNSGSSAVPSTATLLGAAGVDSIVGTGGLLGSAESEATVLLAAGTYTAFAAVQRAVGGNATDTSPRAYVAVYDVGPV